MPIRTAIWKVATPPEPLAEASLPNEAGSQVQGRAGQVLADQVPERAEGDRNDLRTWLSPDAA
jgi:hypothetical protein